MKTIHDIIKDAQHEMKRQGVGGLARAAITPILIKALTAVLEAVVPDQREDALVSGDIYLQSGFNDCRSIVLENIKKIKGE